MNFRTLDLNLLRVFDRVMSEGSLTRAAADLSMTQPAASHALKRLHAAVGEPLFLRTAFGMKPTPRAEALWPQVREALASLRQAFEPAQFDPRQDSAVFRLAMADATAATLAPPLLAAITAQPSSRVSVRVQPLTTRDPRRMLQQDEAELAIGHFPDTVVALQTDGAAAALRFARLYETRYVCVMRRGHPLSAAAMTLDAYCAADHLLVSFSGRPHGLVDRALAAIGRQRRVVLTVNQFFTAGRVVTQSDLLTVLPESFLPATGYANELDIRELPLPLAPVAVQMMWPLRQDAVSAHRWLRGLVLQAAGAA